jgi:hypothetical protein
VALGLDRNDFQIGNRRQQFRVPIDQPLVFIDEAFVIKLNEDLDHRAREPFIHGEAFARPIARGAEPLELSDDRPAALGLPRPDAFQKLLAAHLAARGLLPLHELALDHHLRRDAGVVGAGLPQHVLAAHALEAAENVLQRIVERMAHMQ